MNPKQTGNPTRKKGDGYGIGLKKSTSKIFPFLQNLVDTLPEAVITTDIQTNITGWNAAAERMYGWKAAEVLGKPIEDFLHTQYQNTDRDEAVVTVLENGQWFNTVTQLHKNGTRIMVISSVSVIKDDEGKPVGYVGINRDFTRESRANESARQQSETIEQVLDMLPAAVWVASDPDCNFVYGNHYANDLLHAQDGENVSQSAEKPALRVRHFANGHELSTDEMPLQAAAHTGQPQKNIEMRIESDRFEPRILLGDSAPLFDKHGKPRGAVATFHDITKLRKDEAQHIQLAMMETAEEVAAVGSWVLDLHTQTITWSEQLFRIFGMDREGFDGDMNRIIAERVHPEDREIAYQINRIALEEGIPGDLSFRIQLPDGEIRTLKTQGKVIRNEEGQPVKLIGYVQDITAQHSAEEALRESQSMLNSILDAAPDAMVVINRNGEIILADRQVEAVFGYSQSELVGQSLLLLVPERFRAMHTKHEQNFFLSPRHRADSSLELFALRKDGTEFPAEININHHKVGGELVAIASIRDITERKKVQTELQESERKFSALFNQFHDAVFLLDLQGRHMDANQRAADLLGYTREELSRLSFHEISAEPAQSQNIIERLLKGEHFPVYERLFRRKNGDLLPVEINIELVRDAHGSPMHLQSVVRDISERKKAEEKLKASELRYRSLVENMHEIVMEIDAAGNFCYLSPNYETITGYSIAEELGISAFTHMHPDDKQMASQRLEQVLRDGYGTLTYRIQVRSGAWLWAETTARLSQAEDGSPCIIGVARDITNRIETEGSLRESQSILATAEEVAKIGSWRWDLTTQKVTWSDEMFRLFGVEKESFTGDLNQIIAERIHPEDAAAVNEANRSVLEESNPKPMSYRIVLPDGAVRTVWAQGKLINDNQGKPIALTGYVQDISERVRAEAQIQQMKRLYATLSQVNQAIVRVKEQGELFQSICDMVVKFGEYSLAWVGLLDEESGEIKPVAANGMDIDNWKLPITNIHKEEFKTNLTTLAIQTGEVITSEDVQSDPRLKVMHEALKKLPYRAVAVVPIKRGGKVVGTLAIVSPQAGFFKAEEELALLAEMGLDISFALDLMDNERIKQQWADAFEHSAHGMVIGDVRTNTIRACNPAFAHEQGGSMEEMVGMRLIDMYRPEDHERIKQLIAQSDREGAVQFEALKVRKDGSTYPCQLDLVSVRDENGNLLYRVASQQDITERKRAEESLRISEKRYRTVIENQTEFIVRWKPDGTRIFANEAYLRFFGLSADPIDTTHFMNLVIEEDRPAVQEKLSRLLSGAHSIETDIHRVIKPDGAIAWQEWTDRAIHDQAGQLVEFQSIGRDITKQKRAEDALRESESKYRLLAENITDVIWILDTATSRFLYVSPSVEQLRGYTPEEVMKQSFNDALTPPSLEYLAQTLPARLELLQQGIHETFTDEIEQPCKDGSTVWTETTTRFIQNPETGHLEVYGVSRNINERKRAETALRISEENYRSLAETSDSAIAVLDREGTILYANPTSVRVWGDPDIIGRTIFDIYPPEYAGRYLPFIQKVIDEQVVDLNELETPINGKLMWFQISMSPIKNDDGSVNSLLLNAWDITARKQAEAEIEVMARFPAENPNPVLRCEMDGRLVYANPASAPLLDLWNCQVNEYLPDEWKKIIADAAANNSQPQMDVPCGERVFSVRITPISDKSYINIYAIDITERKRAEEKLEYQAFLLEHINDAVLATDEQRIITSWNPAAEKMFGWTKEEAIGRLAQEVILTEITLEQRDQAMKQIAETGEYKIAAQATRKDGSKIWVEGLNTSLRGSDEKILGYISINRDITERKQAEDALKQSERVLRLFVEHSPASIAMFDHDMKYIVHSRRYVADYQLPDQDLTGRSHYDVFPEIPERWKEIHRRCLAGNIERADEDPFPRLDGRVDYIHWEIHPWYDDTGAIGGIILFSEVITERVTARAKLMETSKQLEESRNMLELIIESAPIRVFWKDTESRYLGCNGLFAADAGFHNQAEIIGKRDDELVWSDKAETFRKQEREIIETGISRMDSEELQVTPGGGTMWVNVSMVPLKDSGGEVIGTMGIYEDITERKKASEELREAREIFQKTFTSSPFAIALSRLSDRTIVDVNVAMEKLLGYSRAELVGRPANDIDYWADPHERQLAFEAVKREGSLRDFEFMFKTKSGVIGQALNYTETFDQHGDTYLLSTFVDITERKQVEEALKESEQRFSTAFFTSPVSQSIITQETNEVLAVNDACCRLFEYSREELIGASTAKLNLWENPADRLSAMQELQSTGRLRPREATTRVKSGSIHTVIVEITPIMWQGTPCLLSTIFDITDRKQAEASLTQRLEELELLYQSGLTLNGELQQKQVTEKLIEALEGKMNWHHVAIRKYDPESDRLELLAFKQPSLEYDEQKQAVEERFNESVPNSSQGMSGWVVRHGQVVRSGNVQKDERYAETYPGIHSGLYVPMMLGERVVGVISVESEELNAFSESDERLLKTIANQAAVAFENARLFQDLQHELTERKQVEEALRENEAFISAVLENLPIGIAVNSIDPTVKFTYMNDNFPKIYRTSREKLSDMDVFWDVVYEDPIFREEIKKTILNDAASGDGKRNMWVDIPITRAGEETTYITARNIPFPGKPMVISTVWDVTERIQAEEARRTSEERLRMTLQTTSDGFWIIDMEGNFLEVNNAYCEMSGYSREELLQMGIPDVEAFEASQEIKERIEKVQHEDHDRFETRHRRKDGSELDVEISVNLLDSESRVMICFCRDITERKRAEREIKQRSEDLLLINTLNDAANRGESIEAITEIFARETRTMFNCQDSAIYLLSQDGQYLEMQSTTISASLTEQIERIIGVKIPHIRIPVRPDSYTEGLIARKEGTLTTDPEEIQKWIMEFTETTFLPAILQTAFKKFIPAISKLLKINATITVPLVSFGRTIGLLDMSSNGEFTPEDLQRVRMLSHQITAVILRKQAESNVRIQLKRITALNEIDRAISSSLDMRLSLDVLLNEVITQLGVDAADILLLDPIDQVLEYTAGKGFRSSSIRESRMQLGQGFAGQAGLERRVVHAPNLAEAGTTFQRANLLKTEHFVEYFGVPLIAKGLLKGVLEIFHRSPLTTDPEWLNYLETLAGQAAIAVDNAQLFEGMQRSNQELVTAYDATIAGWSLAMDLRDKETEGHTQRVTELTIKLAKRLGISEQEQVQMRRGALLHDIGKLGVPDQILLKPGKLTDEEWEIMRQHPTHAYEMLLPIKYLRPALDIPYAHHEKWDGTGYPRKLKGEQIPLAARIFAIIDVWDALRSDRPYRPGWSVEKVREHILEQSGKHFDPYVVNAFMKMLDETPAMM